MSPLLYWPVVIFVTSLASFWIGNRVTRPKRVPVARLADPAPLPGEAPHTMLGYAGRLELTSFAGAADPAQQMAPVPWDLAGAAYVLGQQRASADEITREVAAIIAEIEADPKRWQR